MGLIAVVYILLTAEHSLLPQLLSKMRIKLLFGGLYLANLEINIHTYQVMMIACVVSALPGCQGSSPVAASLR